MISNNKGISMVEVLMAVLLTGVAIVGLMAMQPMAWQSAGKADSMSHAIGIMQSELETVEYSILSGTTTGLDKTAVEKTVGNETFTINTTVTATNTASWLAHVQVAWRGNANGVKSSIIVTPHEGF